MHEIIYPTSKTWYIAYTGNSYSYGLIESNQWLTTGLNSIESFSNETSYLARLNELGLTPNDPQNVT